jgi:predicted outer membrane repeat protein
MKKIILNRNISFGITILLTIIIVINSPGLVQAQQRIIYVKWNANGENNGTNWQNAFNDLQDALSVATSGDEIWVAQGVYKPTTVVTDRYASFVLKKNVEVYGGFSGIETSRNQRDYEIYQTVLSGDIDNNDSQTPIITDLDTVIGNLTNSFNVVRGADQAVLDGFNITAGYANGETFPNDRGGGILNYVSSPTIANCDILGNVAVVGAGIYTSNGSPIVLNVVISGNNASGVSGGIHNNDGNPLLIDVEISNNSANVAGGGWINNGDAELINVAIFNNTGRTEGVGGLFFDNSNSIISNGEIAGNISNHLVSSFGGGGIYARNSNLFLYNVKFMENISFSLGGGLRASYSSLELKNITFSQNEANSFGGGVSFEESTGVFSNVTFNENHANNSGGAIALINSDITIRNNTFRRNSSSLNGGAIFNQDNNVPKIYNSIFWENISNDGSQVFGGSTISYSIIQDGCPLGSDCDEIITIDPLLGILGYYGGSTPTIPLIAGSPAINAANIEFCPSTDQRGVRRPQGEGCDMGAYEVFVGQYIFFPLITK